MSGRRRPSGIGLPPIIPPLILVPTGETIIIEGRLCRILRIERANTSDVSYKIRGKKPAPKY